MKLRLVSFGYKYGKEIEDFNIFYDARFLKNPYWDEKLRPFTGKDKIIWDYILENETSQKFLDSIIFTIESSLEHFKGDILLIGVACSGGQHRSVFVVEYLKKYFEKRYEVDVFHRDITKSTLSKKKSPNRSNRERNPKVLCFGGGHGLSNLLRGLKKLPMDIAAVVNVTDDGGSTGKLREIFNMPSPGDIRRVLLALSPEEELHDKIFNYRFENVDSELDGHTVGNLLLAASYNSNNGDFIKAIDELATVLHINGKVLPIASKVVELKCHYEDGEAIIGQSKMTINKKIDHVSLNENISVNKKVVTEILNADIIVFSQGSLYSSLISNFLFPEVRNALQMTTAKIIYISNLLTQNGETSNYSIADHINAIEKEIGKNVIDTVLINNNFNIDETIIKFYNDDNSHLIKEIGKIENKELIIEDFIEIINDRYIRHKKRKIASRIYELALEYLE